MLFGKKDRANAPAQEKKSLYPVLHVAGSLKEYQQELVKKEVASLWELSRVGASFSSVLREGDQFQSKLQDLGASFSSINDTAGQFGQVREEITQSVDQARDRMSELGQVSAQVQQSFVAMEETFLQLEASIQGIQRSMEKIVSIVEQTDILAINASIEAARAGTAGRGFAVVAGEVKDLAGRSAEAAKSATEVVSRTRSIIQTGVELTAQTAESVQAISGVSGQISAISDQLVTAVQGQKAALSIIETRIGEITDIADRNLQNAGESEQASALLAREASALQAKVEQFTLKEEQET